MAGNTRGKLKEHFEGIHKNFDWSMYHINTSLALVYNQIKEGQIQSGLPSDDETVKALVQKHCLYSAFESLTDAITILDKLVQEVYATL